MKKLLCLFCLLAGLLSTGQANAFSISLSPMDQTILQGGTATVDINLAMEGTESLYGFDFDLTFNSSILGFGSFSTTLFNPNNSSDMSFDYVGGYTTDAGIITFDGFFAGSPLMGNVTLASLTFTGIGLGTSMLNLDGELDLGNMVNGAYVLDPASTSGNVNVVPEPGTALLFSLGLIGLAGARRKYGKA